MTASLDSGRLGRLLDAGRALVTELDPQAVLDRILMTAREVTQARYAALGILDERRATLDRFLTDGIDEPTRAAIGELPRGRGVLGALIREPIPLRLSDVSRHPQSYGFPEGHPTMKTFLGVPIVIRGAVWGNLYLTEKEGGGEFTAEDEEAAVILADWAATAIENARLYQVSERRRTELEQALRGLEATRDISIAVGGETGLDRVLELIVKRGRALVEARSVVIMLCDGPDLVVTASAGEATDVRGHRVPISASTSGEVLERRRPERIADVSARLRIAPAELGVPEAHTALLVPMIARGDGGRRAGRIRSRRRGRFQRRRRAAADGVRRERRERRGDAPKRRIGPPAQLDRGGRRRAHALGAGASRRDPSGPRGASPAALLGAARAAS